MLHFLPLTRKNRREWHKHQHRLWRKKDSSKNGVVSCYANVYMCLGLNFIVAAKRYGVAIPTTFIQTQLSDFQLPYLRKKWKILWEKIGVIRYCRQQCNLKFNFSSTIGCIIRYGWEIKKLVGEIVLCCWSIY